MRAVRLTHIDGKLPNLALMKLSHWYKERGVGVTFTKSLTRELTEGDYDSVYGSSIFQFSGERTKAFQSQFPEAIVGGTGTPNGVNVESLTGDYEHYDYLIYPDFKWSIGFTQRGCRLKCKFCVVPKKEGKPRSVNTIHDIWRGEPHPKNIVLLDNDFFGQENWRDRINEIVDGGFKVNFTQGINIRMITDETAAAIARVKYHNRNFTARRLHTAWDNLKDEERFFDGVDRLEAAGVRPNNLVVYMLIGFDPAETWERILHRFHKMTDRNLRPYPMVYDMARRDLRQFQRWVIRRYYHYCTWDEYQQKVKR